MHNYFTEMCSGSEAVSYLRLVDCVYHSTLCWREMKKKRRRTPEVGTTLHTRSHRVVWETTLRLSTLPMQEPQSSYFGLILCTPSYGGSEPVRGTHNVRGSHDMQVRRRSLREVPPEQRAQVPGGFRQVFRRSLASLPSSRQITCPGQSNVLRGTSHPKRETQTP